MPALFHWLMQDALPIEGMEFSPAPRESESLKSNPDTGRHVTRWRYPKGKTAC